MLKEQIKLAEFDFISDENKDFILEFTSELEKLGYYTEGFVDGIVWGKYMLIYKKANVKSQKVYARIYVRDGGICLRMYFSDVTKKADYIKETPDFIRDVFVGDQANCRHCSGDNCRFRKDYEIDGTKYEKCNGSTFEFYLPSVSRLDGYIDLFRTFYPPRKTKK